ncbi:MAG: sulfotransferase domain-containing protein [Bacillota bacterium]
MKTQDVKGMNMTGENFTKKASMPTVFHVTHYKAGSQWIYNIMRDCFPDDIVIPTEETAHFSNEPIRQNKIYPTVYVTKKQFESVQLPLNWRRFVIIRDLRDTLISLYFSYKISHEILSPEFQEVRNRLTGLSLDDGLVYLILNLFQFFKEFQLSWIGDERLIRYEDLIVNDTKILTDLFINDFKLPITPERLRAVIEANRFQKLTGREPGNEDILSHNRKGIANDWKNYFSPNVKRIFKNQFGDVLIKTGYEYDLNW